MSFRQLRKLPGIDSLVKELAEKIQQSQVEQGVEDVTLFRQNRVDTDSIAYTDTGAQTLNGDKADTDAIAITDDADNRPMTKGTFKVAESPAECVYWGRLEDDAQDYSGNGNHGTLNGSPKFVSGPFRKAIQMFGNEWISIADHNSLDLNQHSVGIFFKCGTKVNDQLLIGKGDSYILNLFGSNRGANVGKLESWSQVTGGLITDARYDDDVLHSVIGVYNGSTRKIFVDGTLVKQGNFTGTITADTSALWIGDWSTSPGRRVTGILAEPRVWARALSDAEAQNYHKTRLSGCSIYDPPLCIGYGDIAA